MNRSKLKAYAPQARRDFIQAITDRAAIYGLAADNISPMTGQGNVAIIDGKPFPLAVAEKRHRLEERIKQHGFAYVMEAMAYTWFNRLVAIRYMEIHGYLEHGYRVLGHSDPNKLTPEILEHAEHINLPGLNHDAVLDLKIDGTKEAQLYRMILVAQCNALHKAMPFLFKRIDDETELLLPDNLLHSDSIIRKLVSEIDETDWQQVEIIGWLYQFYISEKKDQVIGKVVKSEDIPAATQLFTPNWIVKYLIQNSLGRQWLATYPNTSLRGKMEYYIEPAQQTPEVQAQLKAITPEILNPEELTLFDPACGSGHILVEAYDLLKDIYLERGYRLWDIPKLILKNNLFGLEIDDRAVQLAAFALLMKARADDPHIFDAAGDQPGVQPNVLAIQESNDLNSNAIVQAFTAKKISSDDDLTTGEFGFMGAVRAPLFATENRASATVDDKLVADLQSLLALFHNAKTFGSLITVPPELARRLPALAGAVKNMMDDPNMVIRGEAGKADIFVNLAMVLAKQFDAVVANPPYMGSKYLNSALKSFLGRGYKGFEKDLFSAFIIRNLAFAKDSGRLGFMSPFVWMFISSYEELRQHLIDKATLTSLVQLEYSGFDGATVPICTFTLAKSHLPRFAGSYIRLSNFRGVDQQGPRTLEAIRNPKCGWFFTAKADDFKKIPGSPVAYWVSDAIRRAFEESTPVSELATPCQGMATTNNSLFLRFWSEVDRRSVSLSEASQETALASSKKWFPYNKGGYFRRWYGNQEYLVNFENNGKNICDYIDNTPGVNVKSSGRVINRESYFKESISWSKVSSGCSAMRYYPKGFIFDVAGCSIFSEDRSTLLFMLGFTNSIVVARILEAVSPTLNYEVGHFGLLPVLNRRTQFYGDILPLAENLIMLARTDWDSFETSWDFQHLPALQHKAPTLQQSQEAVDGKCVASFQRMKELEEENNRLFIEAYGLQDELSPEVPDDQITLYRPDRKNDMQRMISYCIGCAMGRYSLDKPGLIYANSGNEGFDAGQYRIFPADQDGIIPITEMDWFADDAGHRFEEFMAVVWPKEQLEENLKFVAESLGSKSGETSRETIRRYLADGFFKDHLQTYKRRPIYWFFTSGKQKAFQCLVYLHRYNEATLARMRTEYVIPLLGKINARIATLEEDRAKAAATAHRKRLEKEQELLQKQQAELTVFHDKLHHLADQRIKLDLDDGVKVNYGKFGDLLAGVTQVVGKHEEAE